MRIRDWISDVCSSDLKRLVKRGDLDRDSDPQAYSIGIKELWQVPAGRVEPGKVVHSLGWPLDTNPYGGSFLYHLDQDRIALGYVSGLAYSDPELKPWKAFQQGKKPPHMPPPAERAKNPTPHTRALAP